MDANDLISLPGVLALECRPDELPARIVLERDAAETLAAHMAEDLQRLLPGVAESRLALAGGLFDAAQLLRPQFPAFSTLEELAARLPRSQGGVIAFGARDGRMPAQSLAPDPVLAGSPMLYLPWTLLADPAAGHALGEAMEVELIGRGEAGERTADFLIRALDVPLEHVRYLSRHDLLALTCVQYEHAGLAPLWSVLEPALLTPDKSESTLSARGLPLRYEAGAIHTAHPLHWLRQTQHESPEEAAQTLAGLVFELRQYAAVLQAHHLALRFEHDGDAEPTRIVEHLAESDASLPPPTLHAHTAPGLGIIALSIAQAEGNHVHPLAHALIIGGRIQEHAQALARRYGRDAQMAEPKRIRVDARGRFVLTSETTLH
ncbi:hypothetical protein [Oleiagrimonas sp.]|uniref:hypothetical protein n=1 Tax=Oleiagrimonas sp. TaxID=2010330 RepID=UPI00261834C6|nr:hypothetical protein [Oleiagrimonas sp.]MDA3914148.1 hypothetical protein [Oleiagrimonas sp.]